MTPQTQRALAQLQVLETLAKPALDAVTIMHYQFTEQPTWVIGYRGGPPTQGPALAAVNEQMWHMQAVVEAIRSNRLDVNNWERNSGYNLAHPTPQNAFPKLPAILAEYAESIKSLFDGD